MIRDTHIVAHAVHVRSSVTWIEQVWLTRVDTGWLRVRASNAIPVHHPYLKKETRAACVAQGRRLSPLVERQPNSKRRAAAG